MASRRKKDRPSTYDEEEGRYVRDEETKTEEKADLDLGEAVANSAAFGSGEREARLAAAHHSREHDNDDDDDESGRAGGAAHRAFGSASHTTTSPVEAHDVSAASDPRSSAERRKMRFVLSANEQARRRREREQQQASTPPASPGRSATAAAEADRNGYPRKRAGRSDKPKDMAARPPPAAAAAAMGPVLYDEDDEEPELPLQHVEQAAALHGSFESPGSFENPGKKSGEEEMEDVGDRGSTRQEDGGANEDHDDEDKENIPVAKPVDPDDDGTMGSEAEPLNEVSDGVIDFVMGDDSVRDRLFENRVPRAEPDVEPNVTRRRRQLYLLIGAVLIVVVGVTVGVSVALTRGDGSHGSNDPTPAPTPMPTSLRFVRLRDAVQNAHPFTADALQNSASPQTSALRWLADEDTLNVNPSNASKLVQRYALASLYFATMTSTWSEQLNFVSGIDECEWSNADASSDVKGVISCENGEVVSLDISNNNLVGSLPSEIGALLRLRVLNLQQNRISSTIPPSIGNLTELTQLNLANNQLSGPLPASMGNLVLLQELNLEFNLLAGVVPPELGNMTSLRRLRLNGNMFSGDQNDGVLDAFCDLDLTEFSADCLASTFPPAPAEVFCSVPDCCTVCCNEAGQCNT